MRIAGKILRIAGIILTLRAAHPGRYALAHGLREGAAEGAVAAEAALMGQLLGGDGLSGLGGLLVAADEVVDTLRVDIRVVVCA